VSHDEGAKSGPLMLVFQGEGRANVDGVIAGLSGCGGLTELGEMHNGAADGLTWQEYDAKYGRFSMTAEPSRPFATSRKAGPI
jgi:hypothetical protein